MHFIFELIFEGILYGLWHVAFAGGKKFATWFGWESDFIAGVFAVLKILSVAVILGAIALFFITDAATGQG